MTPHNASSYVSTPSYNPYYLLDKKLTTHSENQLFNYISHILFTMQMSTRYYEHEADFECDPIEEYIFPPDIKRIISHNSHTFNKRLYFFSPSARRVYRFLSYKYGSGIYLSPYKQRNSLVYNLITDDNKHDSLYVSDKLLTRTVNMNKIILHK